MEVGDLPAIPRDPILAIQQLEKDLSLPKGFYRRLVKEDDWSFVIKLHSLIEAALSALITEALGEKRLSEPISRLSVSGRCGKLTFVKVLNLLPPHVQKFIEKLSEIRNQYVHRIGNVLTSLVDHVTNSGNLTSYTKAFCLGIEKVGFDHRELS